MGFTVKAVVRSGSWFPRWHPGKDTNSSEVGGLAMKQLTDVGELCSTVTVQYNILAQGSSLPFQCCILAPVLHK